MECTHFYQATGNTAFGHLGALGRERFSTPFSLFTAALFRQTSCQNVNAVSKSSLLASEVPAFGDHSAF